MYLYYAYTYTGGKWSLIQKIYNVLSKSRICYKVKFIYNINLRMDMKYIQFPFDYKVDRFWKVFFYADECVVVHS